jgi:hypothetical protein
MAVSMESSVLRNGLIASADLAASSVPIAFEVVTVNAFIASPRASCGLRGQKRPRPNRSALIQAATSVLNLTLILAMVLSRAMLERRVK